MPWKETNAMDEKKRFIEEWNRGEENIAELCRRYPDWRFSQLVANVAGWADHGKGTVLYDDGYRRPRSLL